MTTAQAGETSASSCFCQPGYGLVDRAIGGAGQCRLCPANTVSIGGLCEPCGEGKVSEPGSTHLSHCQAPRSRPICRRLLMTGFDTPWYGNQLDGIYKWAGGETRRRSPIHRFEGGRDLCLGIGPGSDAVM
jgi:hypothetical protein